MALDVRCNLWLFLRRMKACIDEFQPNTSQGNYFEGFWRITSKTNTKIEIHHKYLAADFDEDLRALLRRAGCKNEKIVFILDESNILESSFLERMNSLLANGEVKIYRYILWIEIYVHGFGQKLEILLTFRFMQNTPRESICDIFPKGLVHGFGQKLKMFLTLPLKIVVISDDFVLNWFGAWSTGVLYQVGKKITSTWKNPITLLQTTYPKCMKTFQCHPLTEKLSSTRFCTFIKRYTKPRSA
ncbi:unnamed protein product [Porites lobata]|uniref:Dynein heavy chain AAA module D4 domain-containing protein n=1 Tax=Porites lobata TaxID=104759 RepID=A0ABN8PY59_9CNID|nr:unnamed protein product [Porites lobata]